MGVSGKEDDEPSADTDPSRRLTGTGSAFTPGFPAAAAAWHGGGALGRRPQQGTVKGVRRPGVVVRGGGSRGVGGRRHVWRVVVRGHVVVVMWGLVVVVVDGGKGRTTFSGLRGGTAASAEHAASGRVVALDVFGAGSPCPQGGVVPGPGAAPV